MSNDAKRTIAIIKSGELPPLDNNPNQYGLECRPLKRIKRGLKNEKS